MDARRNDVLMEHANIQVMLPGAPRSMAESRFATEGHVRVTWPFFGVSVEMGPIGRECDWLEPQMHLTVKGRDDVTIHAELLSEDALGVDVFRKYDIDSWWKDRQVDAQVRTRGVAENFGVGLIWPCITPLADDGGHLEMWAWPVSATRDHWPKCAVGGVENDLYFTRTNVLTEKRLVTLGARWNRWKVYNRHRTWGDCECCETETVEVHRDCERCYACCQCP